MRLDETLIGVFGIILFKAITVTKAPWYVIKIYIVIEAET